jgi:hypothetical protein
VHFSIQGFTALLGAEFCATVSDDARHHTPDLYLDEIQEQLSALHGLELSLRTIGCTLKGLGMSSKKAGRLIEIVAP